MFDFLKSKRAKDDAAPSVAPVAVAPGSSLQHSDVRREMIRVVLKNTLRQHGVPFGWLACEVIIIARPSGEDELHVQMVLMKWNEQLLRYASALQQQLLVGLDRFDPSVDHSRYVFSWRFAPDCGCPLVSMPEPSSWHSSVPPPVEEAAVSVLDRRHTRRPPKAAPAKPLTSTPPGEASKFAPTQMSPLR